MPAIGGDEMAGREPYWSGCFPARQIKGMGRQGKPTSDRRLHDPPRLLGRTGAALHARSAPPSRPEFPSPRRRGGAREGAGVKGSGLDSNIEPVGHPRRVHYVVNKMEVLSRHHGSEELMRRADERTCPSSRSPSRGAVPADRAPLLHARSGDPPAGEPTEDLACDLRPRRQSPISGPAG